MNNLKKMNPFSEKQPDDRFNNDKNELQPYQCFRLQEIFIPLEAFILLDKNNDGAISYEEMTVSNIKLFQRLDSDKNGAVKRREFFNQASPLSTFPACRTEKIKEIYNAAMDFEFEKLDHNKNMIIDSQEFSRSGQLIFDLVDSDDNNFVDLIELKKHFLMINKAYLPKDPEEIDVQPFKKKMPSMAEKLDEFDGQSKRDKEYKKQQAEIEAKKLAQQAKERKKVLADAYDNAWFNSQEVLNNPALLEKNEEPSYKYDDTAELIRRAEELNRAKEN